MKRSKLIILLDEFLTKAQPEWKAIHEVADKYWPVLEKTYAYAFKELQASIDIDELSQSSINFMDNEINWEAFRKACDINYDIIARCLIDAGIQASYYLCHQKFWPKNNIIRKEESQTSENVVIPVVITIPETDAVLTAIGAFNFRNPKAIRWAAEYVADNIREVETETRKAVRLIIEEALKYGGHPYETAKLIREYIGLTEKQMKSVLNYKDSLDASLYSKQELDELVNAKFNKAIKLRAETIARTETIDAANQGQLLHWDDMSSQGYLDKRYFKKKWSTTPDDRLCPVCNGIDGEIADLDQPFSWGGMRPTRHPKCRCSISIVEIDENGNEIENK